MRAITTLLLQRLAEPRRYIQVVSGPRQVGKTTAVLALESELSVPFYYHSADMPAMPQAVWIAHHWEEARLAAKKNPGTILVLDEIQKIPGWADWVKRLWDEDTRAKLSLQIVLLGSAPLLMQQGLTESLAGRFELIPATHWSYTEMRDTFGFKLDDYIFFGGYPGAAALYHDESRWRQYANDSLIEPTLSKDILLLQRIDKPALLRQLFFVAASYSGQVMSFTKILGQLQDAGNVTTLAHYLKLLESAGILMGIPKWSLNVLRQRNSVLKMQVLNNALMSATTHETKEQIQSTPEKWGRWVESAVGAHLANECRKLKANLHYWREGNAEVDYVVSKGKVLLAIEVKSSVFEGQHAGLAKFKKLAPRATTLIVNDPSLSLEDFFKTPLETWL